jgi:hypothetical protein
MALPIAQCSLGHGNVKEEEGKSDFVHTPVHFPAHWETVFKGVGWLK